MYLTVNQQITPPRKQLNIAFYGKISVFLLLVFTTFMSYGQHIATKTTEYNGDIYHLGGNLGIGTSNPETLLHLLVEHNSSADYPTIRLENIYPKSLYINTWDIKNQENLYFIFSDESNLPATKLLLTPTGSMALGDETLEQSAILQLNSTDKGLLIPRLTTEQVKAIKTPADGLLVYNNETNHFQYHQNTGYQIKWVTIPNDDDFDNFITTETDPVFTAWDKDYNDLTNRPDFTGWDTDASDDFSGLWDSLQGTPPNISIFKNDAGYLTNADVQTVWQHSGNTTYLQNSSDFVGIGTDEPQANLHIRSAENTSIKLENIYLTTSGKNSDIPPTPVASPNSWQITNSGNNLFLTYQSQLYNNGSLISFSSSNRLGLGTDTPQKTLHLKSADSKPTIRFENKINLDTIIDIDDNDDNITKSAIAQNYWDISLNGSHLDFLFGHNQNALQNIFSVNKNQTTLNTGELKVNGTIDATKFIGDGSGLTNVNSFWYEDVNFYQNLTYDGDIVIGDGNIQKDGSAEFIKIRTNSQDWYIAAEEKSSVEQSGFFISKNTSPDNTFYIANNGNIGIGTDEPQSELQVNRNIHKDPDYLSVDDCPAIELSFLLNERFYRGFRIQQQPYNVAFKFIRDSVETNLMTLDYTSVNFYVPVRVNDNFFANSYDKIKIVSKVSYADDVFAIERNNETMLKITNAGKIYSKEVIIDVNSFKDDVFFPDYELLPIDSLDNFVQTNHHLPDIPAEHEVISNGLNISEMQTLQMQKIEELTLYIIELNKQIEQLKEENKRQQNEIQRLQKQ